MDTQIEGVIGAFSAGTTLNWVMKDMDACSEGSSSSMLSRGAHNACSVSKGFREVTVRREDRATGLSVVTISKYVCTKTSYCTQNIHTFCVAIKH